MHAILSPEFPPLSNEPCELFHFITHRAFQCMVIPQFSQQTSLDGHLDFFQYSFHFAHLGGKFLEVEPQQHSEGRKALEPLGWDLGGKETQIELGRWFSEEEGMRRKEKAEGGGRREKGRAGKGLPFPEAAGWSQG